MTRLPFNSATNICIFLLLALSALTPVCAQTGGMQKEAKGNPLVSVSIQPLFLLNNALKLDAEIQKEGSRLVFIVGGEMYNGQIKSLYQQVNSFGEAIEDHVSGFGVNAALKYIVSRKGANGSYYISPGITYRNIDLTLKGPGFYSYLENDIEYIAYGETEQQFNRKPLLVYGNFGFQYAKRNALVIDVFGGIAYKSLAENAALRQIRDYEKPMFGYEYAGFLIQAGVKLGFQFK